MFELQYSESREIWRGILSYVKTAKPWVLHYAAEDFMGGVKSTADLRPDGVICNCGGRPIKAFQKLKTPVVTAGPMGRDTRGPYVTSDDEQVGRMGAEYFLEKGFENFGFVANSNNQFSNQRQKGFYEFVRAAGYECQIFDVTRIPAGRESGAWTRRQASLFQWLSSLARPTAILACNDLQAWRTAEVCRSGGLHMPEEVALLGVGDDDIFCEAAHPPLSSIVLPSEKVGYEAAALLARLMDGEKVAAMPLLLPPVRIESRQSSDILAVKDPDVARAMGYIRENAGEPIRVDRVLEDVPVSRRALERKFREATGRTLLEQIVHAHVERARRLLIDTDLPVAAVAIQSGFQSGERLAVVFREQAGMTPSMYRNKFGGQAK